MTRLLPYLLLLWSLPAFAGVPLTLHEAVQRAQDSHPNVLQAQADVLRAQAQLEQVKANALPALALLGQFTQLDGDRVSAGHVVSPATQGYGALVLTVPVLVPQRWVAWNHAEDVATVAESATQDARWQVGVATARLWLSLLAAERQVEVLERAKTTAEAHLAFAQQRRKGGLGNQLDAVRAAQEAAQSDALVKANGIVLAKMREQLAFLTHEVEPIVPVGDCPLSEAPTPLTETPQARPDVHAVNERLRAATRVVADSYADWLPALYATVTPFVQVPALATVPNAGLQAQLVLNLPLLEWGGRAGQRAERQAAVAQLDAQKAGLARQIAADERAAQAAWRAAAEALLATKQVLGWADEGLRLAQMAWGAGVSTNLEVVDAERRARDAATAVVLAEDAVRQAWLEAMLARGVLP